MKAVVVFPGRFQPAHRGHLSVYDRLVSEFGDGNVFIATTDKQAPVTSPFAFADKVQMWSALGVAPSRIVKVKSPYNPQEIIKDIPDPDNTALILAVSTKDMEGDSARFKFGQKKDGSAGYMQPYPGNVDDLAPVSEHAYIYVVPTVPFKAGSINANSATEVRQAFLQGNSAAQRNIIHDLYNTDSPELVRTFAQRLAVTESTAQVLKTARGRLTEASDGSRKKLRKIIESVQALEHAVEGEGYTEELIANYFEER